MLLATCGGLAKFNITQGGSATIPGATLLEQLVGDVGFGNFASFDITQSQELKNQGVKREQITSVKLTKLSIEVTSPANGQDLTFIDSLTFFVESPGVAKKEIAKGGPFTAGATKADLTLVDLELAPYAAAPSMTFTTAATGKRPSNTTTLDAKATITAEANLAGLVCGPK